MRDYLSRRDFHKLSAAALGGLCAGSLIGCGEQASKPGPKTGDAGTPKSSDLGTKPADTKAVAAVAGQHACRGLNDCKGQGRDHKNSCAGQGTCYTVSHDCSGKNDCKYLGGCGGENGLNNCKGKGGCGHFPIAEEDVWKKARAAFEARRKEAGKPVGPAPPGKA